MCATFKSRGIRRFLRGVSAFAGELIRFKRGTFALVMLRMKVLDESDCRTVEEWRSE